MTTALNIDTHHFKSFLGPDGPGVLVDMYREISSQPQVWRDNLQPLQSQLAQILNSRQFKDARVVDYIGIGSSQYAAGLGVLLADDPDLPSSLIRTVVQSATCYQPVGSAAVVISQSGETGDTIRAARQARQAGLTLLGITAVPDSTLTRLSDQSIVLQMTKEKSIPATASFSTSALAVAGLLMGLASRPFPETAILRLADTFEHWLSAQRKPNSEVERFSQWLHPLNYLAILSDGRWLPVAQEMALKLRETTGLICEGNELGQFQHGPVEVVASPRQSAIRRGTVLLDTNPSVQTTNDCKFYRQLAARHHGTKCEFSLATIDMASENTADGPSALESIHLPEAGPFTPLLAVGLAQVAAYQVALLGGTTPGTSETLRKVVNPVSAGHANAP